MSLSPSATTSMVIPGDALELLKTDLPTFDLIATDPPYAFGGSGAEHELSATVAVVLRESSQRLRKGGWALVFCASSWRSTHYMIDSVRGILEPIRIGTWVKPNVRTKARTAGWGWASVNVIAFRKGPSKLSSVEPSATLDWIECEPVKNGRRVR